MPLYAGFISAEADAGDAVDGVPIVWTEDVGTMRATFTDPDGVEHDLSNTGDDQGFFTTPDVAGWGAAPYEIVTDPLPRGGENVRFIRTEPGRITWPLHIFGATHMQWLARYRAVRRAFLLTVHRQVPGTLRVARPDGSARQIDVFYEEGFKGEGGENWVFANPVLTLFAPDGCWRDVEQQVVTRAQGSSSNFFSPFPAVSASQVLGDTVITNPGDVTAWPVWTVTGPCTGLIATNNTLGQSFQLTATLLAGETATITTDRPTVRGPAGQNWAGNLNWPAAYLWGLAPGDNSVTFTVPGAGSGAQIQLAYYPRYEGC